MILLPRMPEVSEMKFEVGNFHGEKIRGGEKPELIFVMETRRCRCGFIFNFNILESMWSCVARISTVGIVGFISYFGGLD